MNKKLCAFCGTLLILGLEAVAFGSGSAWGAVPAPSDETVTVHNAPYTIHRQEISRQMARQLALSKVSVDKQVSYSDLDLSRPEDAAKLKDRIREAAVDSCNQLEHRFPSSVFIPVPAQQNCVGEATGQALAQVQGITALNR